MYGPAYDEDFEALIYKARLYRVVDEHLRSRQLGEAFSDLVRSGAVSLVGDHTGNPVYWVNI